MNIMVFLIWILRIYSWSQVNKAKFAPETYTLWFLSKALLFLLDTWSLACFYYLFFLTSYWFLFYKLQKSVYTLMPEESLSSQ